MDTDKNDVTMFHKDCENRNQNVALDNTLNQWIDFYLQE